MTKIYKFEEAKKLIQAEDNIVYDVTTNDSRGALMSIVCYKEGVATHFLTDYDGPW